MEPVLRLNGTAYFASDLHLGFPDPVSSRLREQRFVRWLDHIAAEANHLFLLGDLFDFWFEYRQVVPRGFVRLLGKLAQLSDAGIQIHIFTGNHDQWMTDYFHQELHAFIYHKPQYMILGQKKFLLAHGDGLGPGDYGYKLLKTVFRNPFARWLFARLHPNFGVWLGKRWSRNNRLLNGVEQAQFLGPEQEWLVQYAFKKLQTEFIDYFIFGHRHLMLTFPLPGGSTLITLGDWIHYNSYAVFDGTEVRLCTYAETA
ncbi:MAG: UDP-2,3-diacylglucosamine diphosphatase [Chitinophagales bacterium]|nr:UDP-2,3-diacylglucosamine diphosphatase [Chitinophagales bacterium]MDW8428572.1 UDP-2,3-diacylglucosamine diphosphatase [Chitinophagales bacterium]